LNYARSLSLIVLGELFAGPDVRLIDGIEREQHIDMRRTQTSWLERLLVTPPGKTENVIIASNIGRIGKKADEDDMRVVETGKPNLEVNKKGDHFEVELVLQDQSGKTIGAVGIVFMYEKGKEAEFQKKAEQVREEMKQKTPTIAKLFEPAD